jgi:hypothetical protein
MRSTYYEALSAWSTFSTAVVALAAVFVAVILGVKQVREATSARELAKQLDIERSQPYVIASLEHVQDMPGHMNFVVRNYGLLAARYVNISFSSGKPERVGLNGPEPFTYPRVIEVLAPGQEWVTFWDAGWDRDEMHLPSKYAGAVEYRGFNDLTMSTPFTVDWSIYQGTHWIGRKGIHEAASSLEKIQQSVSSWTDPESRSLGVATHPRRTLMARYKAEQAGRWATKFHERNRQERE